MEIAPANQDQRRFPRIWQGLGAWGRAYRIFGILGIGFVGGVMSPFLVSWWGGATLSPGDPVAIANTFIVFTTIIFVGVTVIIAVVSYVVTAQLAATRETQEYQLLESLRERLSEDEKLGIKLAFSILENPDVRNYLQEQLKIKFDALVAERMKDTDRQRNALVDIADQLQSSGAER